MSSSSEVSGISARTGIASLYKSDVEEADWPASLRIPKGVDVHLVGWVMERWTLGKEILRALLWTQFCGLVSWDQCLNTSCFTLIPTSCICSQHP